MERRYAIWDVFTSKPLDREPACRRARRRRLIHRGHAGHRARVQSVRDRLRAAAAASLAHGLYPHLHALHRAAIRRPSDGWRRHPARQRPRYRGRRPIATRSSCWRKTSAASGLAWSGGGGRRPMPSSTCRNCRSWRARPLTTTASPPHSGWRRRRSASPITGPRNTMPGTAFTFVPVRDLDAMRHAQIVSSHWDEAFRGTAGKVFLYCRETIQHSASFHARMFAPGVGVPEDPATGSAAAAFSAVIHRFDQLPGGQVGIPHRAGHRDGPAGRDQA